MKVKIIFVLLPGFDKTFEFLNTMRQKITTLRSLRIHSLYTVKQDKNKQKNKFQEIRYILIKKNQGKYTLCDDRKLQQIT